ncbi:hypothetical protein F3J14_14340 [Burkholderia sp. Tr-862]|uniref:surface-adhesin E family protein n=1 Tax=Burkholderia sp. Tr-862 TaxID=2608331 RepID=UPI001419B1B3|nr:surface-adhesin E family protein [Burkholderia sp. Tr-862]NIF42044.1 hypothetical protein [Burkholderia sp. Tr-862]
MKKLVCAALAVFAAGVHAETKAFDGNWVEMLKEQDPGKTAYGVFYYDANSFERNGEKVSFWEKFMLADTASNFKFVSVSHEVANCETQQHAQIAFISSGPDGVLKSPDRMIEQDPVYKSYPPNSPGAKVIRYICKVGK